MSTIMDGAGNVTSSEVVRSTDFMPEQTDILSTARNPHTNGPAGALKDDTLVNHGGLQLSLKSAERMGLVRKDSSGNYHAAGKQGAAEPQAAPAGAITEEPAVAAAEAEQGPIGFSESEEAAVAQLASQVAPALQQSVVEQVLNRGLDGLDRQLAEGSGMDPDAFHAAVTAVHGSFVQQGVEYFKSKGIDQQEFANWCNKNEPELAKSAMRHHVISRSPAQAYSGLIGKFLDSTAPTLEVLSRAGLETKKERSGRELVRIPGLGWTTVAAAARAKLI